MVVETSISNDKNGVVGAARQPRRSLGKASGARNKLYHLLHKWQQGGEGQAALAVHRYAALRLVMVM